MFFYEILIKNKNINVCCFQVIKNQTNHDYLFQYNKKYNLNSLTLSSLTPYNSSYTQIYLKFYNNTKIALHVNF